MADLIIRNGIIINEGKVFSADIAVKGGRISQVGGVIDRNGTREIDATGLWVMPGIIDDQVHFREPGLTHKADIGSEAKAAVAGGVTSFMEMPNTKPPAITQELLQDKYDIAARTSVANYSFYMGAANDNLEEVLKTDPRLVCGVKAFMGSSTGNMLVDDPNTLDNLFRECPMLIATHCEDEQTIRNNMAEYQAMYGDDIPVEMHPEIRSAKGCYLSSSFAANLAKKYRTRLHILHISTKEEIELFDKDLPLEQKHLTAEVCVHHLFFNSEDYKTKGAQIKCNPAIKYKEDQDALFQALLDNHFDVIATDHAPHTWKEKSNPYAQSPSGLPLIQHSLTLMLDFCHRGMISIERIVEKMCHAPAICFQVEDRGFIRQGYFADLVLVDPNKAWTVGKDNIRYKCGWSPLEGHSFKGEVRQTIVNGQVVYENGRVNEHIRGMRLLFNR